MTVSILGTTTFSGTNISTPITVSHTATNPKGVLILVNQRAPATDSIGSVTYGGVAVPEVTGTTTDSPILTTNAEPYALHYFFLGSGVPSGTQDAVITPTAQAGRLVTVMTFDGANDLEVNDLELLLDTVAANPSATFALNSIESLVVETWGSGWSAVGNVAPLTGWTEQSEFDLGANVSGVYSYDTIGTSDVTCGYSASSDDVSLAAISITEVTGGGGFSSYWASGVNNYLG